MLQKTNTTTNRLQRLWEIEHTWVLTGTDKKKGSGRNEHQRICLRKESDESEAELKWKTKQG